MTHKIFTAQEKIRFQHTDPAGIVFFPRFTVMMNDSTEDLMEILGCPFSQVHENGGMPIVNINVDFKKPGYLGQTITKYAEFTKVSSRSYTVHHWFECDGDILMDATQTCVYVLRQEDGSFKSAPIPDTIRQEMLKYLNPNPQK